MELNFQFENLSEFWLMAGHGPYVWACYGLTALVMVYLVVSPIRRRKIFLQQIARQLRIAEREQERAKLKY